MTERTPDTVTTTWVDLLPAPHAGSTTPMLFRELAPFILLDATAATPMPDIMRRGMIHRALAAMRSWGDEYTPACGWDAAAAFLLTVEAEILNTPRGAPHL